MMTNTRLSRPPLHGVLLMRRFFLLFGFLALFTVAILPRTARACPACSEAVASASSDAEEADTDPRREAKAYNDSIYLMVGMPYLMLGAFGFYVYRGLKKNRAA